ncbi:hypothetical protein D3Y57_18750 [Sphingomonas paeninsulae]|uniref:Uncharacterized protein n=1 Tax=Sphingomonas paeninsulae TaxID=2319844 RepID=A0A494TJA5_SPHPE|nr:hypothetical protein [Sphingomonas paeninsulae]AYJ87584.1 hypothetical protein D3Y57_18750 [Sphingomonas paeninsulae]
MTHWFRLKYLHWFGYFSTAVVGLQMLFVGYFGLAELKRRDALRETTLMQQGPALNRLKNPYYDRSEIDLLNQLPPISALAPDGFRLVVMPSFGDTNFAISLHRTPEGAEGLMVIKPISGKDVSLQSVRITLSSSSYMKLISKLDTLASSWKGAIYGAMDGTGIVFERVKGGSVTSGVGNNPPFYGEVGAVVFDAIRPNTPQLARFNRTWHPIKR